jgi:hypothetical protein
MPPKHVVELTAQERARCLEMVRTGSAPARSITHAQALLHADVGPEGPGWTDAAISAALGITTVTVASIRKTMATAGLDAALSHYRGPRREYRRKLDGHQEAHLIALSRMSPPEGRKRWSLRLLSERMVELGYVDSLSHATVGRVLQKGGSSRGAACDGASHPMKTPPL